MRKTTIIDDTITKAYFMYSGTEPIEVKELLKATGGRPLDLTLESDNCKITVRLLPTPHKFEFKGAFRAEFKEHHSME